jgi:hypothetical protein
MRNLLFGPYNGRFATFHARAHRKHPTDYDSNILSLGLFIIKSPDAIRRQNTHTTHRDIPVPSAATDLFGVFRFYRERCHLTQQPPYYPAWLVFKERCGDSTLSSPSQLESPAFSCHKRQGTSIPVRFVGSPPRRDCSKNEDGESFFIGRRLWFGGSHSLSFE